MTITPQEAADKACRAAILSYIEDDGVFFYDDRFRCPENDEIVAELVKVGRIKQLGRGTMESYIKGENWGI
jgi:hypothetical protein